jgi:hypothetical protein
MDIEGVTALINEQRRGKDRHEAFERLDLEKLWVLCDGEGAPRAEFAHDLRKVLQFYRPGPDSFVFLPAKERKPVYDKLEKAISNIHAQFANIHEHIEWEIDTVSIDFEPEEFEELEVLISGEYAGLSYGVYLIDTLQGRLQELSEILSAARKEHTRPKGKPKQNGSLERTIKELGTVYEKYTGREPMAAYRYDELDQTQPYQGPFFDFLHAVFWTMSGKEEPSGHSIGDAARRAFGLRK